MSLVFFCDHFCERNVLIALALCPGRVGQGNALQAGLYHFIKTVHNAALVRIFIDLSHVISPP